jgi:hypothetical protein
MDVPVFLEDSLLQTDLKRELNLFNFKINAKIARRKDAERFFGVGHRLKGVAQRMGRKLPLLSLLLPTVIQEKSFAFDGSVLAHLKRRDIGLDGYWQSERYFLDIRGMLLDEFVLAVEPDSRWSTLKQNILAENAVSLHVRRGDLLHEKHLKHIHGICPRSYYERAIKMIDGELSKPVFYVFSDDLDWCKENLSDLGEMRYINDHYAGTPNDEMILMSLCDHHIIANSTFGWWGAWLNQSPAKKVIGPRSWFAGLDWNTDDLFPKSWVRI